MANITTVVIKDDVIGTELEDVIGTELDDVIGTELDDVMEKNIMRWEIL